MRRTLFGCQVTFNGKIIACLSYICNIKGNI